MGMKRNRLFGSLVMAGGYLLALLSCGREEVVVEVPRDKEGIFVYEVPERVEGQKSVLELACPPIDEVRVGFVGVGERGKAAVYRFTFLKGVKVVALCDLYEQNIQTAQATLRNAGKPEASEYWGSEEEWKKLCQRDDIDLVYICTDWADHTPMAVYAMQHGKHVAVEVPAAMTIRECWELVNTAEITRRHCMMLENCCYDFFEMTTLNMAQQGVFGELVHVEGAYIHELKQFLVESAPNPHWRLEWNLNHNGNLYPTHGLGPVCQTLNIHRGDRMDYLVSISSGQFGMKEYAEEFFGEDSQYAKEGLYGCGDMSTTIVKTAKGKTIMIQHDITNPRPYSRLHTLSGTKGYAQKYPVEMIALAPQGHTALTPEEFQALMKKYEHPIVKEVGEIAQEVGGHGGMDFIMDYRLIYCLRNGLPLDQDVYDAAEWSSLVELSDKSAANQGMPVAVPDFTRGDWNKIKGFRHAYVNN